MTKAAEEYGKVGQDPGRGKMKESISGAELHKSMGAESKWTRKENDQTTAYVAMSLVGRCVCADEGDEACAIKQQEPQRVRCAS